jgi:hypothetical protein
MPVRSLALIAVVALLVAAPAAAQDATWRANVGPLIKEKCGACHGATAPIYEDWNLDRKNYEAKNIGPRMDNYADFMRHVVWPATGSVMRRLDDGKNAGGKPGNMFAYLGANDEERARNLATIKGWLGGDGAWNLNRWEARGNVPAITKEQLERIKAKY